MKKGFTLIELLIVIGIIAVLSVVVVLTLNPAELLRQARDSTRISDMGTIKSALALYLADIASPQLASAGTACYGTVATGVMGAIVTGIPTLAPEFSTTAACGGRFYNAGTPTANAASGANRQIDGTGWIPVNFNLISSGSPLSSLPIDPTNTATTATGTSYYYAYRAGPSNGSSTTACTTTACTTYELNANMESSKFSANGGSDVETGDGGNDRGLFEVGTANGLAL